VSWLERELREQPVALARLLERRRTDAHDLASAFRRDDVDYILVASRGSSSNVARYAQYLLGRAHRVPVVFATPSLYTLYEQPPRLDGALVVGISQSGESPDVCAVIEEARRQGRPTVAVTNAPGSPLGAAAEAVLAIEAGEERAVAATKTYLNSLGAIALLFAEIGDDDAARAELARMPDAVAAQIELSFGGVEAIDAYRSSEGATVVARGINYCTAFEVALKVRELAGLLVEPYSAADLLHGPIAAIAPGWPVILIGPSGPARASLDEIVGALRERGARLVAISDDDSLLAETDTPLRLVPDVPEWLSPLTAVVPGQCAALRLAEIRGLDLDRPVGLRKITLTR
jgi:glucosamine--fructose-6-phosphate aminotransferase (isomerizing)